MTKKHFVALASALRDKMPIKESVTETGHVAYWQWHRDCEAVALVCGHFNAGFDSVKFLAACKGENN
jgi:hypothetical protein